MTVRYIDYPEDGIHKIEVHSFIKTLSTGEYILSCFDKNKGVYQCIGLIKDHNNYIVDPNMEDVTKKALTEEHTDLDPEQLPNTIKCSIERIQKSGFINFIVINYYYDTQSKSFYLPQEGYNLAKTNQIKIENEPLIIEGKNHYPIIETEFNKLQEKTKNSCTWQKKPIVLKEPQEFSVKICYVGDKTYIPENIFTRYKSRGTRPRIKVDDILYVETSDRDLKDIQIYCSLSNMELSLSPVDIEPVEKNTPVQR